MAIAGCYGPWNSRTDTQSHEHGFGHIRPRVTMKHRHGARQAFAAPVQCPRIEWTVARSGSFSGRPSRTPQVKLMSTAERLVPAPSMSPAGFTVFSEIRASQDPSRALHNAVVAGRVPAGDLPEIIANIWTRMTARRPA